MAAGDFTLIFLSEALRIPGERILSEQPRTRTNFPEAGHNDAGTLWQEGSTYRTKFTWQLQAMALEYERDWFEWLFEVWADTSYEPLEIWDETQILLDLNPPKRHIAPGTTGLTLSANKSHLYPRCEATLMPGSKPSAQYRGHWRGLKVWDIDLQLLEGSMFPYSGNMSPAIPGGVTFITSATDSSGQGPALPNQAPTITLGAASASIAQNVNTSSPINLTTVTINDDGQGGTNTLAISGAGTTILEIVGGQLRIKAGASLSVGVITATITVDDATVGGTPDDSETFTLTVTTPPVVATVTLSTYSFTGGNPGFSTTLANITATNFSGTITRTVNYISGPASAANFQVGTFNNIDYFLRTAINSNGPGVGTHVVSVTYTSNNGTSATSPQLTYNRTA